MSLVHSMDVSESVVYGCGKYPQLLLATFNVCSAKKICEVKGIEKSTVRAVDAEAVYSPHCN